MKSEKKSRMPLMLEEKSMPKFYWAVAVRTAVYIQNRIGDKVSAHGLYFRSKPNLRHLRVFGSTAYVLSWPKLGTSFKMMKRMRSGRYEGNERE